MNNSLAVIIPAFNSAATIRRTLLSLRCLASQAGGTGEVVLVDDGSTDDTLSVARETIPQLAPVSVTVVKQQNRGSSAARNTGMEHCGSEWILFLDADDELLANPLPALAESGDCTSAGFPVELARTTGRRLMIPPVLSPVNYPDILTARNCFTVSSLICRRSCITTPFNPDFLWLEDWLFWIENPALFRKMTARRSPLLARINIHPASKSFEQTRHGQFRRMVAEYVLDRHRTLLSRASTNNLLVQAAIGRIQAGESVPACSGLRLPLSPVLLAKFMLYWTGLYRYCGGL